MLTMRKLSLCSKKDTDTHKYMQAAIYTLSSMKTEEPTKMRYLPQHIMKKRFIQNTRVVFDCRKPKTSESKSNQGNQDSSGKSKECNTTGTKRAKYTSPLLSNIIVK